VPFRRTRQLSRSYWPAVGRAIAAFEPQRATQ
jgi:hypothetical protein